MKRGHRSKVWLLCLALTAASIAPAAHAFKLKTHVIVANLGLIGIADDGTISVPAIGTVPIHNAEVIQAVKTYPTFFRAGALGPDVYPDLMGGQLWVHVNRGNEHGDRVCPGTTGCVGSGVPFERRKVSQWR